MSLSLTFHNGYAIRKIIDNLSETSQEGKLEITPDLLIIKANAMREAVYGRLIIPIKLVEHKGSCTLSGRINLVKFSQHLGGARTKTGKVCLKVNENESNKLHVLIANSVSTTDVVLWTDYILDIMSGEFKDVEIADYQTQPVSKMPVVDFSRMCKAIRSSGAAKLSFSIYPVNSGVRISALNDKDVPVYNKVVGGNRLLTSDETSDIAKVESNKPIIVPGKVVDNWSSITGLDTNSLFINLDEENFLKLTFGISTYGWLVVYVGEGK